MLFFRVGAYEMSGGMVGKFFVRRGRTPAAPAPAAKCRSGRPGAGLGDGESGLVKAGLLGLFMAVELPFCACGKVLFSAGNVVLGWLGGDGFAKKIKLKVQGRGLACIYGSKRQF